MNPQTPKPEPSCPCCRALDPIECCNESGGKHDEFTHQCLSCGCLWDQAKVIPATEPASAGEAGPESVAELQKSREHYKVGANKMVRRIYCLRDGLHQIARDWKGMSPQQIGQFAQLILDREPQPKDDQAVPFCYFLEDDGDIEYNAIDSFSYGRTGGTPLYLHPPAAQPLPAGGVDEGAMIEFMAILHSQVPEVDRPSARSDYSDEQWTRITEAFAWLARSRLSLGEGRDSDLIAEIQEFIGTWSPNGSGDKGSAIDLLARCYAALASDAAQGKGK